MIASESEARAWLEALPEWTSDAASRLELLVTMLAAENERQNLVSAASLGEVWRRHVADSAQLLTHVPRETAPTWLDLGTGAGFPGLVIAALRPEIEIVMVESRARRIEWLNRAIAEMGLAQASVEGARLEVVESRQVAAISARAFAPLPKLLELSARFSTSETTWVLPKGRSAAQELADLQGWNHAFHVEHSLTDSEAGVIVGTLLGRKGRKNS